MLASGCREEGHLGKVPPGTEDVNTATNGTWSAAKANAAAVRSNPTKRFISLLHKLSEFQAAPLTERGKLRASAKGEKPRQGCSSRLVPYALTNRRAHYRAVRSRLRGVNTCKPGFAENPASQYPCEQQHPRDTTPGTPTLLAHDLMKSIPAPKYQILGRRAECIWVWPTPRHACPDKSASSGPKFVRPDSRHTKPKLTALINPTKMPPSIARLPTPA